ncbi:hypothetical protein P3T76_007730 [Phytophthora citrophthora]|uniref:RxLR effector PexRD54 WY domain-containing protein n=1 Tax=Phytophthora citrophthora TaxID=4793 RepID=A0AAD9GLM7_9STRA|nr:hypothetical protein P3T76_007730 [Phytophthora citrophthora]
MRGHWLVLLVATTLVAIADCGLNNQNALHFTGTEWNEERGISTSSVEALLKSDDWLKAGNSADDVFKLLALDNAAENLLANPKLREWITYMKAFNEKNPTKKTSLVATLTAHYGDDGLAKIVEAAKQVPSTATIAKRLQTEQIQRWLAQEKSTDKVFSLLKLDQAGDDVFLQPQIQTWVKYVEGFYKTDTNKEAALFSTLASRYSEESLVQLLINAKKVQSTEDLATRVQAVQTKLWLTSKKKPEYVFNLLKLNQEGYFILKSPLFTAWIQYTDEFRKLYYGTKLTAIATLTKFYDDEILSRMILAAMNSERMATMGKRLEMEQFRNWYIHGKSPKDVFKSLNLYQSGLKAFENPLYSVWTKYATYLGAAEPEYKVGLLTNLLTVYGEGNLLKVLRTANKEPSTKLIATEIQDELLKVWVKAQRDPTDIYSLLRVDKVGPNDPNRLLYIEYVKAYAMS